MKLGFIGLGKMGGNMVQRLLIYKHEVIVYDRSADVVGELQKVGAIGSASLEDMVSRLSGRKIVWMMVPSGKPVDDTIDQLVALLDKNDIIIDGGNSNYKETKERGIKVASHGMHYLDCGTSGGLWGLENGYSLMTGGDKEATDFVYPIYEALAPEGGYTYCGESGAGHFVKMVHNGIEYGMMQSLAEGMEIIEKAPYNIDLKAVASGWQQGSVVRSWLLDLLVLAFNKDPRLDDLKGYAQDSGEGRWTVEAAMDENVPAHVITASLYTRYQSRQDESFAMKVVAALRNEFGGHGVVKK